MMHEQTFAADAKSLNLDPGFVPDLPCDDAAYFGKDDALSGWDMFWFWEDARAWLAERSVYLYETTEEPFNNIRGQYWLRPPVFNTPQAAPPYAVCLPPDPSLPKHFAFVGRTGYAQDAEHHDLLIRVIQKESDHYRIFQRLLQDDAFSNPSTFPCVLPPTALLDTPHNYSFAIMPRWGDITFYRIQEMDTVGEVLSFMHCLLQGLVFLHERRIAHRDITPVNILANCYRYDISADTFGDDLRKHRKTGNIYYALMDYDQSIILPMDTNLRTCTRPIRESGHGSDVYKAWNGSFAAPTYNPFAYDVGMLGNVFRRHLRDVLPMVPACVALFDKMTTHVVSRRWTAKESLRFLEDIAETLTEETLCAQITLTMPEWYDDYWEKLSPELRSKWAAYRTPSFSRLSSVMEWLFQFDVIYDTVAYIRRILNV